MGEPKKLLLVLFSILLAATSLAAPKPIRVGITLGLTGPADRWSKFQRLGLEMAAEDLEKEGYNVELIFEDSRSEPTQSVSNFQKLIAMDRVDAVLGDIFSFVTEPLIPLANQRKKILISPATPEALCSQSQGYFFSTATQVSMASEGYGYFLARHPEVKKVALVYFQDPGWGEQYRDGWRKLLKERGVELSGEFESAELLPDFKTAVLKLIRDKPDAFFAAHEPKSFLAAVRQLGFKGQIVFANNILEIPASGAGTKELEGIYFVDTLAPEAFQKRFEEKFHEPLLLEAYNGYEALRVAVKAIGERPDAPEAAIRVMKYDGISGPLDFSQSCAGNHSRWHLKQFKDGKVTLVQ